MPDKIWANLNSSECQVLAVYRKINLLIFKNYLLSYPSPTYFYLYHHLHWRSDDFVTFSSILKFEGWLSLHIRKTRLILPAETTKFFNWLAKWIILNSRNHTLGIGTVKEENYIYYKYPYAKLFQLNKVGKEIWSFIINEFFNFIIKSLFSKTDPHFTVLFTLVNNKSYIYTIREHWKYTHLQF